MSNNKILWIHADNLNPDNILFQEYPNTPAIFVWDDELLRDWQISLKRMVFMYESLLELPVTIRRGKVARELIIFAQEHKATQIITLESPSPRQREIAEAIKLQSRLSIKVEIQPDMPFVDTNKRLDLKRFSRYWRNIQSDAMQID